MRTIDPAYIELHTCGCSHCKGRAAVCMEGFDWFDRRDPAHVHHHAQEDLLDYFDRLDPQVKDALNRAEVNVCSWCAEIWARQYGPAKAARLIRDVRLINDAQAVTPIAGWDGKDCPTRKRR